MSPPSSEPTFSLKRTALPGLDTAIDLLERARPDEVQRRAAELASLLGEQLAREGALDGLMREALLAAPKIAGPLQALLDEGVEFVAELRDVGGGDPARVAELGWRLRDYSRRSARLLAKIWYEETGGGD